MGVPPPPDFEIKGEYQTTRKMVERGRRILKQAFGKKGWRERVEKMKAEREWWQSLSQEQRDRTIEEETLASDWAYYQGNLPTDPTSTPPGTHT